MNSSAVTTGKNGIAPWRWLPNSRQTRRNGSATKNIAYKWTRRHTNDRCPKSEKKVGVAGAATNTQNTEAVAIAKCPASWKKAANVHLDPSHTLASLSKQPYGKLPAIEVSRL